jgi:small subunit ribosomal protein S13
MSDMMAEEKDKKAAEADEEAGDLQEGESGGKPQTAETAPEKKEDARQKSEEDEETPQEKKAKEKKKEKKDSRTRIVRMGGKDLDGDAPVKRALKDVRGVSFTLANAIAKVSGLGEKKVADLSPDELRKVEEMLLEPGKYGIPGWALNRRLDPEEGKNVHLISAQLELRHKMDINELKKRKCYRGVRHIQGLPVRGQRTRSSFRKSATVGVSRAKAKPAAAGKK